MEWHKVKKGNLGGEKSNAVAIFYNADFAMCMYAQVHTF